MLAKVYSTGQTKTMATRVAIRASVFALASGAAVWLPVLLGRALWPDGLNGGAEFIFWLATAVDVAGLLILGWRYWPVILLNALSSMWSTGTPLHFTFIAAAGDAICSLLTWWALHRFCRFNGSFSRVRTVALFILCAAVGPLPGAITGAAFRIHLGQATPEEFWLTVGNWALSDGAAMLLLTPFLVHLAQWKWGKARRYGLLGLGVIAVAFVLEPLFRGQGMNFVFLIFPFLIYVAVSWERQETATALALVLAGIYWAMARFGHTLTSDTAPSVIWFIQAFAAVLGMTALLLSALVSERRRAETRALEISVLEERARLDALRYQLNPHFLFNSLNSIYSTLHTRDAETSRTMVTRLAAYLRSTLAHRHDGLVPLRHELESIRQYLAIEQARFGEDLQVAICVEEEMFECAVPGFLLQPLVENAIVHGFATVPGRFLLEIRGSCENDCLSLEVANTGTWKIGPSGCVGLENTRRRLSLTYGDKADLTIITAGERASVKICLPLDEERPAMNGGRSCAV